MLSTLALLVACATNPIADTAIQRGEARLVAPETRTWSFQAQPPAASRQARLSLRARIDGPLKGGSNPWIVVRLNGQPVVGEQLLNKPLTYRMRNGTDASWVRGNRWRIVVSPDFSDALRTDPSVNVGIPDVDPFTFVWDVGRQLRPGSNELSVELVSLLTSPQELVLADITLAEGAPLAGGGRAPSAPVSGIVWADEPLPSFTLTAAVSQAGGVQARVGSRTVHVLTRVSEPKGRWKSTALSRPESLRSGERRVVGWSGVGYSVRRTVQVKPDRVEVSDAIRNTSARLLGLMVEHRLPTPERARTWLRGLPTTRTESLIEPRNPTAVWADGGLAAGLVADGDLLRAQTTLFREPGHVGLGTRELGIAPGETKTLEWSLFLAPRGDYWDVINRVRTAWGANQTLPGPATFDHTQGRDGTQPDLGGWVAQRGLKWVLSGQSEWRGDEVDRYGGNDRVHLAEGTAIPLAERWNAGFRRWQDRVHAEAPGTKVFLYLIDTISTEPGAQERYADSRMIDSEGRPMLSPYRYPVYKYAPTRSNSYGRAMMSTARWIVDELDPDGIYLDGWEWATGPHRYNDDPSVWDGATVRIDPRTHEVQGKRSITTLLQLGFKQDLVAYFRSQRRDLLANGAPMTRSTQRLGIPRFVEVASFSNLAQNHLSTPVGLGTMLGDDSSKARAAMAHGMLDFAGILMPYTWNQPDEQPWVAALSPLTPTRLEEGMVLGRERIVTNRSGSFGWRNGRVREVWIVDAGGGATRETKDDDRVTLRLDGGSFAVIVRG